jgi:tetracycline 7-halogenase / FADH2 O2-dependent halogenase
MDVDLAIVGSGFGGSILAMVARRIGLRVALLERGRHPRFAIGESSSPLAGILIEQLADRYDLPRLKPLAAFGAWQRAYPDVVCGLKRGFTYFKQEEGRRFAAAADRANELLVAASPNDELSDTHWLRADVDAFLLREAEAQGVEYADEVELDAVEWTAAGHPVLMARRRGAPLRVAARGMVDATGPRGFLGRALGIEGRAFDGYPATQALFSHFTGVARCDEIPDYAGAGARGEPAPYPVDDAALHHCFDGGWMWVLRFGNGVTSAGVAVTDPLAEELKLADGEPAWQRLLDRFPSVRAQFADARPTRRFDWMPRLSYRAAAAAGPRWALLPSAAAFVDPLFSTGFPLTLLGIERLAALLESGAFFDADERGCGPSGAPASLGDYSATTLAEADHTARFVAGCYAGFPHFDDFVQYSMFYFAAASYAEMARRVAPDRAAAGFLRAGDPAFASALCALTPASTREAGGLADAVRRAIEPVNIAGLCVEKKRNWYSAETADAIAGASKLGVAPATVAAALSALGFGP